MDIVYATSNNTVNVDGRKCRIQEGQPWDADAQVVRLYPSLFVTAPERVQSDDGPVEVATAVPGEKRSTRRTRK